MRDEPGMIRTCHGSRVDEGTKVAADIVAMVNDEHPRVRKEALRMLSTPAATE